MKRGFVYILTNRSRTLYIGVTNDLERRVFEHKAKHVPGFTQRCNVSQLVYWEEYPLVRDAIAREKRIKGWTRTKKIALIESMNPEWRDLAGGTEILRCAQNDGDDENRREILRCAQNDGNAIRHSRPAGAEAP